MSDDKTKATSSTTAQQNPMKQPNPPKMPTQEHRDGSERKFNTGGKPNGR